jgi:virulence factor Mce-like protein
VNKKAPTRVQLVTLIAFASACVGLLIFMWISFGGVNPIAPQGYRFSVEFDQAFELASESDVRIAGVSVGKVLSTGLDHHTGLTRAVIEINPQFAPRPADTRAILRQKSLLGETYVELSPGSSNAPKLPDGGSLPRGQVAPTVQLDQILSTFNPSTRRAFQTWVQDDGVALTGRGTDVNEALAQLYPFATGVDSVLAVLRRQSSATTAFLHDGSHVLASISQSPAQLQGLISNSNAVFAATAARDTDLASTVKALPPFLNEAQSTVRRLTSFAGATTPLLDELIPAAVQLNPALEQLVTFAPQLRTLLNDIGPLARAADSGFPALSRFLDSSVPLLTRLKPYLGGVVPVLDYVGDYRREIAAALANTTASTEATLPNADGSRNLHYLRASVTVNPETLTAYQHRLSTNRGNPYMAPGGSGNLLGGLSVFGSYLCTRTPPPTIGSSVPATLAAVLKNVYFTADPSGPPCKGQQPLGTLTVGRLQQFPHLTALP